MTQTNLIGREKEKNVLLASLEKAIQGKGVSININGQPGIGKTTLVNWICDTIGDNNVTILRGAANPEQGKPFLAISSALEKFTDSPLFEEQEYVSFSQLFAINPAGMLIANASHQEEDIDADIFAGMLTAVQSFVRDSFDSSGTATAGLGRLEYGSMKVMIEHGQHLFLVAVLKEKEHTDMAKDLRHTVNEIESTCSEILENWNGQMSQVTELKKKLESLIAKRFLVKRNLEGVKLEAERVRIASRVLESVIKLSSANTVLFVLEDLHWADDSSIFVIRFLARNIHNLNLMMLGTSRDSEGIEWQKNLKLMKDDGLFEEINLDGLDRAGVANIVQSIYSPNNFPQDFPERLHSDCAGNPFFVTELLRQMRDEGAIADQDGVFSITMENYQIPASIEEVVKKRLDALDPDCMAMAEYISCIGKESDISIAKSIQTLKNPSSALDKLAISGIINISGNRAEFSHAIFHGAVYGGISRRWLEVYHKKIGEHYEHAYAGNLEVVYYELARHYSSGHVDIKAFDYCTRAGEKAEGSFAMEQALEFYRKALAILPKARLGPSFQQKGLELHERMGDILMLTGSYDESMLAFMTVVKATDSPEVKARMFRKSSDAFQKRGDYDGCLAEVAKGDEFSGESVEKWRLLHQRSYMMLRKGEFDKSIAMTREIISKLQENPEHRRDVAMAQETLGSCFYLKGEFDLALEHYRKALDLYEQIGEFRMLGTVQNNIGNVYGNRAQHDLALEHYNKTLAITEKLGDKHGLSVVLMNIAAVHQSNGELDKALEINLRSLKMGEMLGDQRIISAIMGNIGGIYQLKGEPERGLETLQKCLVIKRKIDDKQGIVWVTGNIGIMLHYLARTDEARDILLDTVENAEKLGAQWDLMGSFYALGELYKDTDEMVLAEDYFKKAIEFAEKLETPDYLIESMKGLVEILLATGRLSEGLAMSTDAVQKAISAGLRPTLGSALISQGMALAANGDMSGATRTFSESESICRETSNFAGLARAHYEWGMALANAGQKELAVELLTKALGEFEKIHMVLWHKKCVASLALQMTA